MCYVLSLFLLLAAATTNYAAADSPDIISSGNYLIHPCKAEEPSYNATYLQQLLPQIHTSLQAVIADANLGTASKHGYGAFFETNDNIEEVVRVYQHMVAGSDLLIKSFPGRNSPGLVPARPTFVCIEDTLETTSIDQICSQQGKDVPSVIWTYSNTISICPQFWEQKVGPVARTDCPKLRGQTLSPNNDQLLLNQQAMIVHGLAHVYGGQSMTDEIANIQDAVSLDSIAATTYANSFAYYYSG